VVYGGGVLAPGEVAAITLQDGELAGYEFVEPGEVAERVSPLLARRIAACVDAVVAGTVISLEDGCPVTLLPAVELSPAGRSPRLRCGAGRPVGGLTGRS
jgi:hypothetical protein